ncbi:hypothetical protein IQ227_23125 [Anabaena aphanizomenioides LEGE 00250]|uniref:Bacteriocin n=1 Tax=Sphaerospermopsis aphanizomenoides LEGE 00250 TaxID=2777972 RepID=A0ABR9VK11_9CYAN|nr:hypothetical protein [Sphaerospermopsis aphanizomenoides]MBE9238831.1 hypothetical protein [Sphaerospermopsis aphanizomenoides LEGE 00250]
MANIAISELRPAGFDLFMDSESYMYELKDEELENTMGGIISFIILGARASSVRCGRLAWKGAKWVGGTIAGGAMWDGIKSIF